MDRGRGGGCEVKFRWCPDGLFHGLSLEQRRSVMNSNRRVNMRDVCVFTGAQLARCVSYTHLVNILE